MNNIAVYAGSFDPFTNGHLDIVRRAAKLFDKVIILLAVNPFKSRTFNIALMANKIYDILQGDEFQNCSVYVAGPEMFTVDIAEHFGAKVKEYMKSQPELVKSLVPEPIYDLIIEQEEKK